MWLIRISIFLFILLILFSILYFTNNLDSLLRKTKKEVNKLTVISIILFVLLFMGDVFKGWVTKYISDLVFPNETKAIKEIVETIDDKTATINKTTSHILENTNIDPRIIKSYLNKLASQSTIEEQKTQIKKWYGDFEIDSKLKDILIVSI